MTYYFYRLPSPIGEITVTASDEGIVGVRLSTQQPCIPDETCIYTITPLIQQVQDWLKQYFSHNQPEIGDLPLSPNGTAFQQTVWKLLYEIPYGQTTTYGQLARQVATIMGKEKMSAQAVGQAVGANPISILIPCHRVLGVNGKLTGYAGGVQHKIALLTHEGISFKL